MSVGVWKPDCNIRFSGRSSLPAKHSAFKTTRSCIISAFLPFLALQTFLRLCHGRHAGGYPHKRDTPKLPCHGQYSTQARQPAGKCSLAVVGQHKYRHTISPHTPGRHLSGADCKLLYPRRQPTAHHPKGTPVHIHPPGRPPHFLVKKRCATQSFTRLIIYLYG